MRLAQTLTLLLASLTCVAAGSEEVALPANRTETAAPSGTATTVTTPARGASMAQVEAQSGAPTERHAAIGNPPISRWDYPGFSVFFEHQHVVHSVVR